MAPLSREQFGQSFASASRLLWVVASAYVPRCSIEDVLQDAVVTALARLEQFAPGTNFNAWMAQIVRYTAANHGRGMRKLPTTLDADAWDQNGDWSHDNKAHLPVNSQNGQLHDEQTHFDDEIVRGLAMIHEDARACLLLSAVMEFRHADIAQALGLVEGTVASHIHRARRALRSQLGVDSSDSQRETAPPRRPTPRISGERR